MTIAVLLGVVTALLVVAATRAAGVRNAALLCGVGLLAVVIGLTRSAGIAAARALRHSPHAIWIPPLVVVAARLLLDPLLNSYYPSAAEGLILVGAAVGAAHWTRLRATRHESFA